MARLRKKCDRVLDDIEIVPWFKLVYGDFPCKDQTMVLMESFRKTKIGAGEKVKRQEHTLFLQRI